MPEPTRIASTTLSLENRYGIPVRLFANEQMKLDQAASEELAALLDVADTVENIRRSDPSFFDTPNAGIVQVAVTPDFHKAPVIDTQTKATMVRKVAELRPILTVKG